LPAILVACSPFLTPLDLQRRRKDVISNGEV